MNAVELEVVPSKSRRSIVIHSSDRVNFARAALAFPILLIPLVPAIPSGAWSVFAAVSVWFLSSDLNFVLHQHVHRRLSDSRIHNRSLDLGLGIATGMSASSWRQHHILRHHVGDDSWARVLRFEARHPRVGALTYTLRDALGMLFLPLIESYHRGVLRRERAPFDFLFAALENSVVFVAVGTLVYLEPVFYGTLYVLVYFFTALTNFQNHVGCEGAAANNVVDPLYNQVRDNFGFHEAHHRYPGAHWSDLPNLHAQLVNAGESPRCVHRRWVGLVTPPLLAHALLHLFSRARRIFSPADSSQVAQTRRAE
jgi:fatty acid desaturase